MPDIHLTDEGRAQAQAAADRLAKVPFKAVYSSPIDRTVETAAPIAESHGLEIQISRELGEVEYGKWTNRSFKTLTRTKMWTIVHRFPSGARFPEGETLRSVQARAVDELERIRKTHAKHAVCVVSHADVIRLVAAHYLGVHLDLYQRIVIDPGSITVVAVGDEGPRMLALNAPAGSLDH